MLFYSVFGGFYGDFHGLIWEFSALFYMVFAFQVFSVAHIAIFWFSRPIFVIVSKILSSVVIFGYFWILPGYFRG